MCFTQISQFLMFHLFLLFDVHFCHLTIVFSLFFLFSSRQSGNKVPNKTDKTHKEGRSVGFAVKHVLASGTHRVPHDDVDIWAEGVVDVLGYVEVNEVTEVVVHVYPYLKNTLLFLSTCHNPCYHIRKRTIGILQSRLALTKLNVHIYEWRMFSALFI